MCQGILQRMDLRLLLKEVPLDLLVLFAYEMFKTSFEERERAELTQDVMLLH